MRRSSRARTDLAGAFKWLRRIGRGIGGNRGSGIGPPALDDALAVDPDGRDIILRMTDFMMGHQEVAAEALATYEAVQESGQKIHFDLLQRMAPRKPDKLLWVTLHDNATVDRAWF